MDQRSVTFIGAGVIGLFTGWIFARKGWHVTVLERGATYGQTSLAAAGLLTPFDGLQTGTKQQLQRQSLWMYPELMAALEEESGLSVGYHRCGRIRLTQASHVARMQEAVAQTTSWSCPQPAQEFYVDGSGHPLVERGAYGGYLRCHVSATLDPQTTLRALHLAIERHGGAVHFNRDIRQPKELGTTCVIHTAGVWAGALCPDIKLVPLKKEAITLELPEPINLDQIVEDKDTYIVPRPGGRKFYIGTVEDPRAGINFEPTTSAAEKLIERAARMVPSLRNGRVVAQHVGVQPKTPVGRSMYLGEIPHVPGHFVAAGHGGIGFGLAPVTAQSLLSLALGESPAVNLSTFTVSNG